MSFDKFLLAVESSDLSQADKILSQSWVIDSRTSFSVSQKPSPELSVKWILSEFEIDHVIQQPKETCQRTCRGPYRSNTVMNAKLYKIYLPKNLPNMLCIAAFGKFFLISL